MATSCPNICTETTFNASRDRFEQICSFLGEHEAETLTHSELEQRLSVDVRDLVRRLYQDHLDLRAVREQRRDDVVDADGIPRGGVEAGHARPLRELSAVESSRGSFEDAKEAIERITGVRLGKRQLEQLAVRAAADFEAFYSRSSRSQDLATEGDLPVLSADGKGIVMRPDALRPATAKAAGQATAKLSTRLSKGEKHNRKRMAEVGAVYDLTPVARTATDIIGPHPGRW